MTTLKTSLIKIGNSQGIRIPKTLIEQLALAGEIELEVVDQCLVLKSAHTPRKNWDSAFQGAKGASEPGGDDFDVAISDFDGAWKWK